MPGCGRIVGWGSVIGRPRARGACVSIPSRRRMEAGRPRAARCGSVVETGRRAAAMTGTAGSPGTRFWLSWRGSVQMLVATLRGTAAVALAAALAACTPQQNADVLPANQALTASTVAVRHGDLGSRVVQLQGGQGSQAAGAVLGGLAGAALGQEVGGGTGQVIATGVGATAGAAAGLQAGKTVGRPAVDRVDGAARERRDDRRGPGRARLRHRPAGAGDHRRRDDPARAGLRTQAASGGVLSQTMAPQKKLCGSMSIVTRTSRAPAPRPPRRAAPAAAPRPSAARTSRRTRWRPRMRAIGRRRRAPELGAGGAQRLGGAGERAGDVPGAAPRRCR